MKVIVVPQPLVEPFAGISSLAHLRQRARTWTVDSRNIEFEAQYGVSPDGMEKLVRNLNPQSTANHTKGLVTCKRLSEARTISAYADNELGEFFNDYFVYRFRPANESYPFQCSIKCHRLARGFLERNAYAKYGSTLTARFEYEDTIDDSDAFDPNNVNIFTDPDIRNIIKKVIGENRERPVHPYFLTDVDRTPLCFDVFVDSRKAQVQFEISLDRNCRYYELVKRDCNSVKRISELTGSKIDGLLVTECDYLGNHPYIEIELKATKVLDGEKDRVSQREIFLAEKYLRDYLQTVAGCELAPEFDGKADYGYYLLSKYSRRASSMSFLPAISSPPYPTPRSPAPALLR